MSEIHKALNDLLDAVEILTLMFEELNPGANEQIGRLRFLIDRASDCVERSEATA